MIIYYQYKRHIRRSGATDPTTFRTFPHPVVCCMFSGIQDSDYISAEFGVSLWPRPYIRNCFNSTIVGTLFNPNVKFAAIDPLIAYNCHLRIDIADVWFMFRPRICGETPDEKWWVVSGRPASRQSHHHTLQVLNVRSYISWSVDDLINKLGEK